MGLNIEDEIKALNKRLKAGGTRVTIEKRKGILLLRGTFPPKKQSPKTQPYQQRLFLGFKASRAGLRAAEQQAKIISAQLELKTFKWSDWVPEKSSHTFHISQWIKNYEKHHWEKTEKNRKSIRTWNDSYMRAFSKFLDLNQPLTIEAILNAIATTKPDTKTRQIVCMGMIKLAKFADIKDIQKIPELKGNYSPTKVHPRNLPTDTEISTSVDNIKHPGWKWLVATLATYGLRSHECFHLDMSEFPVIRVLEGKTGERVVYPLYPEWSDRWNIGDIIHPPIKQDYLGNNSPGQRISRWFWDSKLSFKAYDLRHSYARRCFEFDIPTNRAAKLMGHSENIHCQVYRAWIDEGYYRAKFDLDIFGEDKPKAPNI